MKALLRETYNRINDFEEAYYQTLINATELSAHAM